MHASDVEATAAAAAPAAAHVIEGPPTFSMPLGLNMGRTGKRIDTRTHTDGPHQFSIRDMLDPRSHATRGVGMRVTWTPRGASTEAGGEGAQESTFGQRLPLSGG